MEANDDAELVAAIASDVMTCLVRASFFDKLDNLLSPVDDLSKAELCSGDYTFSKRILLTLGFEGADWDDVFAVLRSKGGSCDCEILYNAVESSRLKSQYWRDRAEGLKTPVTPHRSHD